MSLFQTHKRFIQMGAIFGVAPYQLKDHYFETSSPAAFSSLLISCLNLLTIYQMVFNTITNRESYANKPFGYALLSDGVFFFSYSSGCFIIGGVFFSRKKLIARMNRLSDHPIMLKTYEHERIPTRNFCVIIYGILSLMCITLLMGTMADNHFHYEYEIIFTVPLLASCVLIFVQFLVAIQVIYLSYRRIQYEIGREVLTVEKIRQCSLLDIWLKDFASVVEEAYGPFISVYISLSFLYVLTIELYIAEGGPTYQKAITSYVTVLPPLTLFVWFIRKCTLITHEAENMLHCLHGVAVDVGNPDVREAIELFSLQLLSRELKLRAGGCFSLDYSLLYSMIGAVTTYVVTLVQFQAAFYS